MSNTHPSRANLYWIAAYFLLYILNFLYLSNTEVPSEDIVVIFLTIGLGVSLIAYLLTIRASPLVEVRPAQGREWLLIAVIIIYASVCLLWGSRPFKQLLPDAIVTISKYSNLITTVWKVVILIIIPFYAYRLIYGFTWSSFGLSTDWKKALSKKNVIIFVGMSVTMIAFNFFLGGGAQPLREGLFSARQITLGLIGSAIWLFVEVGLVEEFFFRALLQSRITALLKSEGGGICISGLIFGIIHAPGMFYRGAGVIEGLGGTPSFILCVSYCIAVQSIISLPFGIIWSRTRNLWLLAAIHVMTDLTPNLAPFIKDWGL